MVGASGGTTAPDINLKFNLKFKFYKLSDTVSSHRGPLPGRTGCLAVAGC